MAAVMIGTRVFPISRRVNKRSMCHDWWIQHVINALEERQLASDKDAAELKVHVGWRCAQVEHLPSRWMPRVVVSFPPQRLSST